MADPERNDDVGNLGELVFELAATDFQAFPSPLFRLRFLGAKWPAADYLVMLRAARGVCFVQVKATEDPLAALSVNVRLTSEQREDLVELPGPTYLVGVHIPSRRCFIRSIDLSSTSGVTTIPLKYELNPGNLQKWYDEVKTFWAKRTHKPRHSVFV